MESSSGIRSEDQWHVSVVAETGSTNDDLLRAAERGDLVDRTVLRAEHQTAGRGRLDRRWDAPPGSNLLASIYLEQLGGRPEVAVQRVGVAVVDAISAMAGQHGDGDGDGDGDGGGDGDGVDRVPTLGLKWPNDALLGGRKLAGVLAQRSTMAPGLVVGFGVNVSWAPPGAACVHDLVECSPADVLGAVLAAFDDQPRDLAVFAEMYRTRLLTLGELVEVQLPGGGVVVGRAVDVDDDGRLVVSSGGGERSVFGVGDIVHLRPGSAGVGDAPG